MKSKKSLLIACVVMLAGVGVSSAQSTEPLDSASIEPTQTLVVLQRDFDARLTTVNKKLEEAGKSIASLAAINAKLEEANKSIASLTALSQAQQEQMAAEAKHLMTVDRTIKDLQETQVKLDSAFADQGRTFEARVAGVESALNANLASLSNALDSVVAEYTRAFGAMEGDIKQLQEKLTADKTLLEAQGSRTEAQMIAFERASSVNLASLSNALEVATAEYAAQLRGTEARLTETITQSKAESLVESEKTNRDLASVRSFSAWFCVMLLVLTVGSALYFYREQSLIRQAMRTTIDERLAGEMNRYAEALDAFAQQVNAGSSVAAPDHSLALKLADEITTMERNLSLMEPETRGVKQLNRSVGKLRDNLAANGYEIADLLGKPYREGMKVQLLNAVRDERLAQGQKVISRVVKPQVSYQDKVIQIAQVDVSVG